MVSNKERKDVAMDSVFNLQHSCCFDFDTNLFRMGTKSSKESDSWFGRPLSDFLSKFFVSEIDSSESDDKGNVSLLSVLSGCETSDCDVVESGGVTGSWILQCCMRR